MEHTTPLKTGVRFGLILGLATVALGLIGHYMKWNNFEDPMAGTNFIAMGLGWAIIFGAIFFGLKYFKQHNEGQMTLGEGVITSLFIGLISGIIAAIFMYVFMAYLVPDMADTLKETIASQNTEMSSEEAETSGKIFDTIYSPVVMSVMAFFNRIFAALIFGLIASLIVKSD